MKRLAYILMAAALVFACAPEKIVHPSEADAPATASAYSPSVSVDQETNQVTFSLNGKAVIPVWVFQDNDGAWTVYKAQDDYKRIFASAGDYSVRMYVMNAAGMTPDYVEKSFHIENSIVNFDRYIRYISGSSSKVWRIDNAAEAHLACGPSVDNPTEWYKATPDEKKDFGLYDNRLTFTSDGAYQFDPGEAGTVYVNTGVTASPFGDYQEGSDYNVPVEPQEATYEFNVRGDDLLLTLPAGSLFPYIPNNDYVKDATFHLISLDNNAMTLIWYTATGNGGGSIAWQFILTSKAGETVFNGFNYNADSNLWKPVDADGGLSLSYYYAPGWSAIADPVLEKAGNKYTWTLPTATSDRWQAQMFMVPTTAISLTEDKTYDFSCILSASADITMKVKVHRFDEDGSDADNGVVLVDQDVKLKAGEDYVFYQTDLPGIAANNIRIVLDWGGNPDNCDVSVSRIVLKDHAIDDGTVLPDDTTPEEPEGGGGEGGLIEGENLWADAEVTMAYWYSAADWSGALQPAEAELLPGNGLRVVMPDGIGGSEWMGQNSFHAASLPASVDEVYDFWMTLEADEDMTVTVKLAWEGHDTTNEFFYDNAVQLKAGEPLKYVKASIVTDMGKEERNDYDGIVLFVDTGRSPAGSEVKMTDIHFQKHIGGSPDTPEVDYTTNDPSIDPAIYDVAGAGNLWRGADIDFTYWYSSADWSGNLAPITFPADDWGGLKIIVPEGIGGNEWMGQSIWHTDIAVSADNQYDFCFTVKSDEDINGLTVKLAWEGHDGEHAFFYVNDAVIKAGVPYQFRKEGMSPDVDYDKVVLFVDLGRAKVGTAVSFTDFCLQKNAASASFGENLWTTPSLETWFSAADWSGGLNPGAAYADGKLTLTVPEGTGGAEWQGQVKLSVPVAVSAAKKYDFSCKILLDDNAVVTVKLADANDDSNHAFFYDGNVSVSASTALTYKQSPTSPDQDYTATMLIFDFGRTPVGTQVTVSDIVLREIL